MVLAMQTSSVDVSGKGTGERLSSLQWVLFTDRPKSRIDEDKYK